MQVLGINARYHDRAAALVVDGAIAAAAEEERFSRRKYGNRPVPSSACKTPDARDHVISHGTGDGDPHGDRPDAALLTVDEVMEAVHV